MSTLEYSVKVVHHQKNFQSCFLCQSSLNVSIFLFLFWVVTLTLMWSLILNYYQTLLSLKVVSRYQCCYVGDPLEYWAYQESCLSKSERYTFLYISFLFKVLIIVVARSFIFICFQTLLWNKVVYRRWRCNVIAPWKNKLNVSPWNIIFNLVWAYFTRLLYTLHERTCLSVLYTFLCFLY